MNNLLLSLNCIRFTVQQLLLGDKMFFFSGFDIYYKLFQYYRQIIQFQSYSLLNAYIHVEFKLCI